MNGMADATWEVFTKETFD